jgi:hypothetical protein
VQIAKRGGRKLFDEERREVFLEWFAATCNVKLAAEKAGVAYQTLFKHRMKDPAFAQRWDAALQQGYARVEARLLQEVHAPGVIASGAKQSRLDRHGSREPRDDEVRVLDEELAEEHFDPQLALQLLREHARRLSTCSRQGCGREQRTTARSATSKEIADALAKRLKGFALRHGSGQALRVSKGAPPPSSGWSPSPANAGEDE